MRHRKSLTYATELPIAFLEILLGFIQNTLKAWAMATITALIGGWASKMKQQLGMTA